MKKFPIIEMKLEKEGVFVELPEDEPEPELPKIKNKPEDIFVKKAEKPTAKAKKESKASDKQLAHLETIRAKALLARQNKKKEKPVIVEQPQVEDTSKPPSVRGETLEEPPEPPPPLPPPPVKKQVSPPVNIVNQVVEPSLYTKSQMDDYVKGALVNYHTQERDRRIAEVRKKQAELEEQRKKYDVSTLLKKGGKNRMW